MPEYSSEILNRIDELHQNGPIPDHIGIIMDGNGRWARRNDVSTSEGHREGVISTRAVADLCGEIGTINALTLYAFSTENWARPDQEITALMNLLKEFLRKEVDRMIEQNVRFETIGKIHRLPDFVQDEIQRTKELTAGNDQYVLNLALDYGSRNELTRTVRSIAEDIQNESLTLDDISEDLVTSRLDTADLPDLDFLIRTSGEYRLSNFLLWQVAYSEIYFTKTLWPDFREHKFLDALFEYQTRDRRFGKRMTSS